MFTSTITRPKLQTAVLKWFADQDFSFEQETLLANSCAALTPAHIADIGLVVGKITRAVPAVGVATFVGTGNGVLTKASPAADPALAQVGNYLATLVSTGTNAGQFEVRRPDGTIDGYAEVGVAYTGQVKFTIADGSADFVNGDQFTLPVTVAAGSGKVVPLNTSATDGSQVAIGVVVRQATETASLDAPVVVVERQAVLLSDGLIWPSGISDPNKATALAQLAALGLIVRNS